MAKVVFPFGKEKIAYDFDEVRLNGILTSSLHSYKSTDTEENLVKAAMAAPFGTEKLSALAKGKNKVVIIASDHTRPVPSKVIIPFMLSEIREGNPNADITILIATGCHRGTTRDELVAKFGEEIVANEKIYVHDCEETDMLVNIGTLPSGGECIVNRLAVEADLLVSEGFIEPHFFAGYSGGRKSVLPGVCSKQTVLANHCAEFIHSKYARTGIIENNPIHIDMVWAARAAKLAYIVNVVINEEKKVVYAVAGDVERAHEAGCAFLSQYCGAKTVESDIVISTNGGYPLDQNIYQSVKGMTAAEAAVRQGGVIIMLAAANDGTGGEEFYRCMNVDKTPKEIYDEVMTRGRNETVGDQWMTQILSRILMRASVIYVSTAPDELVKGYHMIPAKSLGEAMAKAEEILGDKNAKITAIPDGVSVMVTK
ncbi:MAG: nickel-dependent lactate racemase [Ruminococcaceae bacterium]|nr:nickel-dependent lactate racemase [Oscillospiraceae bacterium]